MSLLKSAFHIVLFSPRGRERQRVERLECDPSFRWFVGVGPDDRLSAPAKSLE